MVSADDIIRLFGMKPLPGEGGYYAETYRSADVLDAGALPARYGRDKTCSTTILYLLTPDTCSVLHKLPTDEVYHFYLGDPVTMLQLFPDGTSRSVTLGPDILNGQQVQVMVPRDTWQGSMLRDGGRFALMGTTMAPGFDFSDFEPGERQALLTHYPDQEHMILRLTTGK